MKNTKTYITLCGLGNTGKTSTLKKLILKFIENGAKIELLDCFDKDFAELSPVDRIKNTDDAVIKLSFNNRVIGITTRGDSAEALKEDFEKLGECEIYVCATHTRGNTIKFIKETADGNTLIIHDKWSVYSKETNLENEQKRSNEIQAEELFEQIKTLS